MYRGKIIPRLFCGRKKLAIREAKSQSQLYLSIPEVLDDGKREGDEPSSSNQRDMM